MTGFAYTVNSQAECQYVTHNKELTLTPGPALDILAP